ncbi:hypothetical protein [Halococcus saccharolyticus]|uniref:Uncharacterized protein n=1 Tax=Halococcus saccharolyticus DSM 5350 TaxID=1227455 RepID=M0MBC7_9EURY|nr:hypothetical protein [Halococcus saccharolyticus]EMA42653.1 hypothetical protein C449_15963 [Halococcus saccharolyticus DSM 5350]
MSDTGVTFGGAMGATYGGATGSVYGGTETEITPTPARGATFSGPAGATYGGVTGALYSTEKSADQLLAATDSWGLVVEPTPAPGTTSDRLLFTTTGSERDADGALLSFSATDEALAASSIQVEFAAEPRLFRFAESNWVLGFDGDRVLSGQFEAPDADTGSQQAQITGFGPLQRLKSGGVEASYQGIAAWRAIREFAAEHITPRTDGEIRVVVVPPEPVRGERVARIPADAPLEVSGTPLSAFAELCGYAGMVWSVDYSERGPGVLVEVFLPGTQVREARWTAEQGGVSPQLDTGDYHTDVVVHGADYPAQARRYRGEASAPGMEARAITGGERKVFEVTKPGLASDAACREFAISKLDELRGSYQISGDIDALPGIVGDLVPGHTHRVSEFDTAAPEPLSPVVLPLRSVEYSYAAGEANRTLSFGALDDGVIGTLLSRDDPPLALRGLARLGDGTEFGDGASNSRDAYSSQYPNAYP